MEVVVITTGAISRAKLQSNHHHQQTNIQFFYRPDGSFFYRQEGFKVTVYLQV